MNHADYLRQLLEPLGVYDLTAPYNAGELDAQGRVLDGLSLALDEVQRETDLTTAESWGLEGIAELLKRRPTADSSRRLRTALAALLRIGGDSFTLEAINDTISGCGVYAYATETGEPGVVEISFPDIPGIPRELEEIRPIIEDILPAHLEIRYVFWYIIWNELEQIIESWDDIAARALTWERLETMAK